MLFTLDGHHQFRHNQEWESFRSDTMSILSLQSELLDVFSNRLRFVDVHLATEQRTAPIARKFLVAY